MAMKSFLSKMVQKDPINFYLGLKSIELLNTMVIIPKFYHK